MYKFITFFFVLKIGLERRHRHSQFQLTGDPVSGTGAVADSTWIVLISQFTYGRDYRESDHRLR